MPPLTGEEGVRLADAYAAYIDPVLGPRSDNALRMAPVGEGDRVLDVATGVGALALRAARQGARVVAVDITPAMVRVLIRRARQEGLDRVEAQVMDGQALALKDQTCDAAFSLFGLTAFPDPGRGFHELHRVLRPGGRAVVTAWQPGPKGWKSLADETVARGLPDADLPDFSPLLEFGEPARLRDAMEAAGFAEVEVELVDHVGAWPDVDTAWHAFSKAGPLMGSVTEADAEARGRLRSAFQEICARRFGSGPVRLPDRVFFAVGRKAAP